MKILDNIRLSKRFRNKHTFIIHTVLNDIEDKRFKFIYNKLLKNGFIPVSYLNINKGNVIWCNPMRIKNFDNDNSFELYTDNDIYSVIESKGPTCIHRDDCQFADMCKKLHNKY